MTRSFEEQVALALCPKFSGALSIFGASWIIFEVLRDRKKRGMVYHRLLLSISVIDALTSVAWFMSTWPIPSDVDGLYANIGNDQTCNAQGWFIQLKAANPFYNTFLSLYFVLVVKFGWTEEKVKSIEPLMHATAILMALGTSTVSLALDLFGNANLWCWIEKQHSLYRMFFFYIWYWASLVAVTLSMGLLYWTVRSQERASRDFSVAKRKNTSKVATQAVLYIGAYYLTALFATIVRVMQAYSDSVPFWAILCMTIFYPAQGLMNFLIYIRPRYCRYRQNHPDWTLLTTFKFCLKLSIRGASQLTSTTTVNEEDDYKLGTPLEDACDSIESTSTATSRRPGFNDSRCSDNDTLERVEI